MLNNGKSELGKFYSKRHEGIFIGYFSTIKAYRFYNKRTLYIEESVHVIFDESKNMEKPKNINDIDMKELIPIQRDSAVEQNVEAQDVLDEVNDKEK